MKKIKLSSIFDIARGGSPRPIQDYLTDDKNGINWIMIGDTIEGNKYIEKTAKKIKPSGIKKSRKVYVGDFLLTNSMSFGRPYILKIDGCIHDGWLVLSPRSPNISTDYFYYLLSSQELKSEMGKQAAGAVVKNLNSDIVRNIEVKYPDLPTQTKIAQILDKADQIRQKRKKAIELADEFLRSLFLEMFGDPVVNSKQLPLVKLSNIGSLDRGKSKHRPRNDPILLGGVHPLIQTGDVANCNGYITHYSSTYSDIGLAQSKKWKKGTLCITIAANIAKTGILQFDACFPDSIVGFQPNKKLATTEYIRFWFTFLQKILEKNAPESAQKNINLSILKELELPLPNLDKQEKFSEICGKVYEIINKLDKHNNKLNELFNSLSQQYFTKAG